MELIDADALIKDLEYDVELDTRALDDADLLLGMNRELVQFDKDCKQNAVEMLKKAPPVDAEPVRHGKWIMKSDPFGFFDEIPVCSECGCTTKLREKTKFCPNCGAKMDAE